MNEELKIIIRAELAQFKQAMEQAIGGLRKIKKESTSASKEIDGFTSNLNQQRKQLDDLKRKYVDLAAAHGKESKEAKDAAEAIKTLSAAYKENRNLAESLANNADALDLSLGGKESSQNVDKTKESVDDLQGSLESIRNLDLAGVLLSAFGPELRKYLRHARADFEEMATHVNYAWTGLFKNGRYYKETGEEWQGLGEAIKGFFYSSKAAGESFASGMKNVGAAVSKALSGIVGVLVVIIADLLIVIGLTKNAINIAKELKEISNAASKAGMEISTYQEWGYVLKQVGIEEDKLTDFTKKLAERQNELRDGSEDVAKAFEAIGISQEEVLGSNQEELFRKSVAGLQNIENASERTSMSFRIFSDDATDLANLLYLNNEETRSLIDNFYELGGAPSDNLINKSKELAGSTTNLSYAWQGLKNTLAEWVIPAVITVVQWLTTAVAYINAFLQGIFGVEAPTKKAAAGIENVSGGVNKVGTNAKKATGAVKELLRYTMGFDELNVIPKQSTGGSSDGGSGSSYGSGYGAGINPELPVIKIPDMSKFRAFMDEYGSLIQGIMTWSLIVIGIVLAVLGFMSGNVPLGLVGISLAGLGIGVGAAGGEESHWNKLGDAIVKVIKAVGDFFVNTWNGLMDILSTVGSWIYDNVIAPVAGFFKGLWEGIVKIFSPAINWFAELFGSIGATIESVITVIVGLFKGGWILIQTVWGVVATWFDTHIISPVAGFFSVMWEGIKTAAGWAWEGIKKVFSPVAEWFSTTFKKAWEGVKNVFSTGAKIFMGIVDGIADVFKTVVNAIIDGINKVVAVPFNAINGMLNKIRGVSVAGVKPFEGFWGYNPLAVPQIPKLATGGIATSSILANIGEAGKEAVLPLDRNTEWMDKLADRINSRNQTPTRVVLMVGEKELGYATIGAINGITQQTGTIPLYLY